MRCAECGHPIRESEGGFIHLNLQAWAENPHPAIPEDTHDPGRDPPGN